MKINENNYSEIVYWKTLILNSWWFVILADKKKQYKNIQ